MKSYSELKKIRSIEDRFKYLRMNGSVGRETFGSNRYFNQRFYSTSEWRRVRRDVIVRDNGCDLGVDGFEIQRGIVIHHINPITLDDILEGRENVLSMENLICCSSRTHRAIHYGDEQLLPKVPITRQPQDTTLW